MSITLVLSTSLLLMIFYTVKSKSLQLLEILFCWMIVIFLYGLYFAVVSTNLQLITAGIRWDLLFSYYLYKFILIPLLFIWYMDLTRWKNKIIFKLIIYGFFTGFLTCSEYGVELLHVLHHEAGWNLWWSIVTWAFLILVVAGLCRWVRQIIQKDLKV